VEFQWIIEMSVNYREKKSVDYREKKSVDYKKEREAFFWLSKKFI
jgi:hypothetical protein